MCTALLVLIILTTETFLYYSNHTIRSRCTLIILHFKCILLLSQNCKVQPTETMYIFSNLFNDTVVSKYAIRFLAQSANKALLFLNL